MNGQRQAEIGGVGMSRAALPRFPATLLLGGTRRTSVRGPAPASALPSRGPARRGMGQADGPAILDMAAARVILGQVGRIEANQAEVNAVLRKYPDQSMTAGLNDDVVGYLAAFARLKDAYGQVTKRAAGVFSGGGDDMAMLADFEMLDALEKTSGALARKAEDVVEGAGAARDELRVPPLDPKDIAGSAGALSTTAWAIIIGGGASVVIALVGALASA